MLKGKTELIQSLEQLLRHFTQHQSASTELLSQLKSQLPLIQASISSKLYKYEEILPLQSQIITFILSHVEISSSNPQAAIEINFCLLKVFEHMTYSFSSTMQAVKKSFKAVLNFFEILQNSSSLDVYLTPIFCELESHSETKPKKFEDFCLILLKIFNFCLKTPTGANCDTKWATQFLSFNTKIIVENIDYTNAELNPKALISCEKFEILLEILYECSKKPSELYKIVIENREKIKECFILSIRFYMNLDGFELEHVANVESRISKLFQVFLEVLSAASDSHENFKSLYDVPVIIFHLIISNVSKYDSVSGVALKRCILQFLQVFYIEKMKKFKVPLEVGIEDLLLSSFLLQNNDEASQDIWEGIWNSLCTNVECSEDLFKAISLNLKANIENFEYLSAMNQWISSLFVTNIDFVTECVNKGLAYEILNVLSSSQPESTAIIIFQIVTSLLNHYSDTQDHQHKLLELIFSQIISLSDSFLELSQPIIRKILNMQSLKALEVFIQFFKNAKDQKVIQALFSSALVSIKNEESSSVLKEFLVSKGFEKECKKLLPEKTCPADIKIDLWKQILECLETLSKTNESRKHSFDFCYAARVLRMESQEDQSEIIRQTIESLFVIAFSKTLNRIKTPSAIWLVCDYLSQAAPGSPHIQIINHLLEKRQNLMVFVKNGLIQCFLHYVNSHGSLGIWSELESFLTISLRKGITLITFSDFIQTLQKASNPTKLKLLALLKTSLSIDKLIIDTDSSLHFSSNHSLTIDNSIDNIVLSKSFSIALWALPNSMNMELLTIYCSDDYISIGLKEYSVVVKINSSPVLKTGKVYTNMWTLICVDFQLTKGKVLKKKQATLTVFSQSLIEKNLNDIKISDSNKVKSITIGSEANKGDHHISKIKSFYIMNKSLQESEAAVLFNLTHRQSLFSFVPVSYPEIKVIQDLRDSLIYSWNHSLSWEGTYQNFSYLYYNSSHIFDVINAYNPLRLLHELIRDLADASCLCKIYQIFYKLTSFNNYKSIFTEEVVMHLCYALNSLAIDNKINIAFLNMINTAGENFSQIMFDQYLLNGKCVFLLGKTKEIDKIIQKFIKSNPINQINLYKFCNLIKGIDYKLATKFMRLYLDGNIKNFSKIVSTNLLQLLKNEDVSIIKCILEVILHENFEYNSMKSLFAVLLHILEKVHDPQIQIFIIKILCFRFKEEKNSENTKNLLELIGNMLPDRITQDLIKFLLQEGLECDKNPIEARLAFVDMAVNRIKFVQKSLHLQKITEMIEKSEDKVIEFIGNRDTFPCWLIFACKMMPKSDEINSLCFFIIRHLLAHNSNINKIKEFFQEVPNISLYNRIVQGLKLPTLISSYEAFLLLNAFPLNCIKANLVAFLEILEFYLSCPMFMEHVAGSLDYKFLINKVKFYETEDETVKVEDTCYLVGEFFKFCLKLLKTDPRNPRILQIFLRFFQHESVSYFCKHEEKSKKKCEEYSAIYIFYKLVKLYYRFPENFAEILEEFTIKSQIFNKIASVLNGDTSETVFFSINDEKSIAILSRADSVEKNGKEFYQIKEDILSLGNDYITLNRNAEICQYIISQKHASIVEILDKKNMVWMLLYEKIGGMMKNYKKIDDFNKRMKSSEVQQASNNEKFEDLQNILKKMLANPWIDDYLEEVKRVQYKMKYDFEKFERKIEKTNWVLSGSQGSEVRLRQCYDKCYRWVFLKTNKRKSKAKSEMEEKHLPRMVKMQSESLNLETYLYRKSISRSANSLDVIDKYTKKILSFLTLQVEQIKVQGSYFGEMVYSTKYLEFISKGQDKGSSAEFMYSALNFTASKKFVHHIFSPSEISEVILRRFIHRHTAIEIVLNTGKAYYFNLFSEKNREKLISRLSNWKGLKITGRNPGQEIDAYTAEWKKYAISTFEYLMLVNKFASRSMQDISQYPVFPWIIIDFVSESIKTDEIAYRNLTYPVGGQTEKQREEGQQKFLSWSDDSMDSFIFGHHYSSCGIVTHYLLRIEPFTSQALSLQDGSFDVGDRLFYSLGLAWESCLTASCDVKELIPELFYQPWALSSYTGQVYGSTQAKEKIVHFIPPKWAVSNWDFLKKHRLLLENSYTSREINNWIDLIFGCNQKGKKALAHCNIFTANSYEDNFEKIKNSKNEYEMAGIVESIYHFGQTPLWVFQKNKHAKRDEYPFLHIFDTFFYKNTKGDLAFHQSEAYKFEGKVHAVFILKEFIILVKTKKKNFYLMRNTFKSAGEDILSSKEYQLRFCYERSFDLFNSSLKAEGFLGEPLQYSSGSFAVYRESLLISSLQQGTSVFVHNFKGQLIQLLHFHTGLVTSVSSTQDLIISSSLDSSIASWKLDDKGSFILNLSYSGHTSPVLIIKAHENYSIIVSANISGFILVHDIRSGEVLVKILQPASSLDVSDIGIIAISYRSLITFLGLNGEIIYQEDIYDHVKAVKFNALGDYCLVLQGKRVKIKDPTNPHVESYILADRFEIVDVTVQAHEKFMIICECSEEKKQTALRLIRLSSKQQREETHRFMKEII